MASDSLQSRLEQLYSQACEHIDQKKEELRHVSEQIWLKPELNHQEHFAHDILSKFLEDNGFTVTRHFHLETAFRAVYACGSGGVNVAVLCEYDALPEIGHACGHNLIAEAGIAAGIGMKQAVEHLGSNFVGTITVLGTPAEEGGAGKIKMLEGKCFDGIDVALMAHPSNVDVLAPLILALNHAHVTYQGHAAHAAAAPWEGVNALDAAVSAYTSLSMLRQQMKPNWRVHAIIKEGGVKPNIIPERASLEYYIRAPLDSELAVLKEKVSAVMQSAALATGCEVSLQYDSEKPAIYSNMLNNSTLISQFSHHWKRLSGIEAAHTTLAGSTDMGNVSYAVPSIHPMFRIGTNAPYHTRDFQKATNTPQAHEATLAVAKSIACTGLDVLFNGEVLKSAQEDFQKDLAEAKRC